MDTFERNLTEVVRFRASSTLAERIKKAAERDDRSVSSFIRHQIRQIVATEQRDQRREGMTA